MFSKQGQGKNKQMFVFKSYTEDHACYLAICYRSNVEPISKKIIYQVYSIFRIMLTAGSSKQKLEQNIILQFPIQADPHVELMH